MREDLKANSKYIIDYIREYLLERIKLCRLHLEKMKKNKQEKILICSHSILKDKQGFY